MESAATSSARRMASDVNETFGSEVMTVSENGRRQTVVDFKCERVSFRMKLNRNGGGSVERTGDASPVAGRLWMSGWGSHMVRLMNVCGSSGFAGQMHANRPANAPEQR